MGILAPSSASMSNIKGSGKDGSYQLTLRKSTTSNRILIPILSNIGEKFLQSDLINKTYEWVPAEEHGLQITQNHAFAKH